MQIEEGKFYRTRRGVKAGPMRHSAIPDYPFIGSSEEGELSYTEDGKYFIDDRSIYDIVSEWNDQPAALAAACKPEYQALAGVLQAALDQAATGKGSARHSDGDTPFLEQPIMEIARMLGDTGGHSYQIMKKAQEANRMVRRGQYDAAVSEYLGVINYAAAAILLIREL